MKTRLKKFLNKHKNKIVSFSVSLFIIPLFSVNAFALTTTYPQYNLNLDQGVHSDTINMRYKLGDDNIFYCDISSAVTVSNGLVIRLFDDQSDSDTMLNFPIMPDVYDYYIYTSYAQHNSASDGGTFQPTSIVMSNGTGSNEYPSRLSDIQVYRTYYASNNSNYNLNKMNFVAKLNLAEYSTINYISAIKFLGDSGTLKSRQFFEFSVFLVPKGEALAAENIISAIEEQTDVLGGYIDKGNGSTGGIVSGNNSAIDNLDDVVSEYRATEETFFDDFNTNQQAITSDIVGWSWGGLVNCADWVGATLTSYYNNMGDFRQYIIYPLMLGIALFFLGRGGSIIGHLFRKPTETTVNTKSVFRRDGNTRYTTTTTSRQGGVWRK